VGTALSGNSPAACGCLRGSCRAFCGTLGRRGGRVVAVSGGPSCGVLHATGDGQLSLLRLGHMRVYLLLIIAVCPILADPNGSTSAKQYLYFRAQI